MKFAVFDIIQSMENVWNMEWKKLSIEWNGRFLSMEWKISMDMKYKKFLFHSIPQLALVLGNKVVNF